MKILLDTSVIVDIDRGKKEIIELCEKIVSNHKAFLSTVTVSEILTGSYLRTDYSKAIKKAERLLTLFTWIPLDGDVALIIAELNSALIVEGLPIEFQDVAIAASFHAANCDFLLTDNKEHFTRMRTIKDKVLTPKEFKDRFF
jgi:predicted nucleic acid-binding protein